MKKINIIYSYPVPKEHWIEVGLKKIIPHVEILNWGPKKKKTLYRKYGLFGWIYIQYLQMNVAYKVIKHARDDELIITLDYGTGRFCSMFSSIKKKEFKILALNCLQFRTKGIKRFIENIVDRLAWKNPNYITTVNQKEDISKICIPEDKKGRVAILEDVFIKTSFSYLAEEYYDCFTGGYANRDFCMYFELAKRFPARKFVCVVGSNFNRNNYKIPDNVLLFTDINEKKFWELMKQSRFVIIPLLKDETSGLVVLKDAIKFNKIVLASNISAVKKYIPVEYRDSLLSELLNIDKMEINLNKMFNLSKKEYSQMVFEIISYNDKLYSPSRQCVKIKNILKNNRFI